MEAGSGLLVLTSHTLCIPSLPCTPSSFRILRETCCGLGGISTGAGFIGFQTVVFNDRSPLACDAIKANKGFVVQGDIADRSTVIAMHQAGPDEAGLLTAGFPCQPYSRLGDQGGMKDSRGKTLCHIFRAAWLMQSRGLLLENVAEILSYQDTVAFIRSFADRMDFLFHSTILELGDQWVSKRRRWWGLMLPSCLPPCSLYSWPALQPPLTISDAIPEWPVWPLADEQDLAWTEAEHLRYDSSDYGYDCRRYDQLGQAPTAVHSLGVALQPCPCGCRDKSLSDARLRTGGLRGVGVTSQLLQCVRHPHPSELGVLNSLPAAFQHVSPPRSALCLVGQLAAPMQALWILAQVQRWNEEAQGLTCLTEPLTIIHRYKAMLVQQRRALWILPSMQVPRTLCIRSFGSAANCRCLTPVTAAQVIEAEQALLGTQAQGAVLEHGRALAPTTLLHGAPVSYELVWQTDAYQQPGHQATAGTTKGSSDAALWLGLQAVCCQCSTRVQVLPATVADGLLQAASSDLLTWPVCIRLSAQERLIAPFLQDGHWTLLTLQHTGHGLLATCHDGIPGRNSHAALHLARAICQLAQCALSGFQEKSLGLQQDHATCGAIPLAHCAAFLQGEDAVFAPFLGWSSEFLARLPALPGLLYGLGGLSDEQHNSLRELLLERGVPANQVQARSQAACAKLGEGEIAKALLQRNPWPALKTLASQPGRMFRWVLHEELQAVVEHKASQKFGTSCGGYGWCTGHDTPLPGLVRTDTGGRSCSR